ncbi:MAG: ABC transporter permease [Pleurocapsa minor GSE-CHR-MK-17-07R]|jgi:simple sugar transport system permease protein|nr:ABC transporter permease [Pleurocapsa minor GSE-CHR-MK 17-07R]
MNPELINILSSIIANATPLVIAGIGETISERSGVTNLSLDGSLQLSAMVGFAAALATGNILLGCFVGMLVGALIALIVVAGNIELRQDQVALGFVLTLLCADIAQFLGQDLSGERAITMPRVNVPLLADIPIIGPIFFQHTAIVYVSYALIFGVWWWMFHTRGGLALRASGDRPETAFARGTRVNRLRYFYTILGGALVGLGGAAFSLAIKPGWSNPPAMRGEGWIALAIVIFGGWHPFRVVLGAYLFAVLRALASAIQRSPDIDFPLVLLNLLPWLLMIGTLVLVSSGVVDRLLRLLPERAQKWTRNFLRSDPPTALGTRFDP